MEASQNSSKMLQKYAKASLELAVLLIQAVFIYLEELFRLLVGRPEKSIEGEVVLVTGAANGLGYEICRKLVKCRAKIVLWDMIEKENMRAADELRELWGCPADHVFHDVVDVSDREEVRRGAERIRRQFGHVSILVNNAGICPMQQFLELSTEAVQNTFKTNIIAHFWTIQEFLPHMLQVNKGHIVTIASTMSKMSIRGPAPYYATKHAVHGFIESLKDELAHQPNKPNIKFTTAYPFFMKTRMVHGSNCGLVLKFKFPSITPFKEPADVANTIVEGILQEKEHLYIPEHFRIYLAGCFFLPSKLHRLAVDFFVEDDSYSVQLGGSNGSDVTSVARKASFSDQSNGADSNSFKNGIVKTSTSPLWLSENIKEKGK